MDLGPIGQFFLGKERGSVRVNEAVRRAESGLSPQEIYQKPGVGAPAQMTPEQRADWQRVGLGQMKLGEFREKHGFLPAPTNDRGLFAPPGR
jgi:hypothetical protein